MTETPLILIVDDNLLLQQATVRALSEAGYRTCAAADGQTALRVARSEKPDLILLDVALPDLDGFEVCRQLKSDPTLLGCFVVMLSSRRTDSPSQIKGLAGGADGYIVRPIPAEQLLAHVNSLLRIKQTEDQLRASEERYRTLVEQASEGIFVADPSGRYIDVNSMGCAMLGYTRAEILQKSMKELVVPDELSPVPIRMAELQTGQVVRSERYLLRKDGSRLPVEISGRQLSDGRLQGIVRDITERKQTEETRNRLAAIVESSDDAIISKTLQGVITSWNKGAENIYGYTADEVIGRSISILTAPGFLDEIPEILERVKRGEGIHHYETKRRRKNGSSVDVALTISPIKDARGNSIGASTIARDITERKQVEEDLQTAEKKARELWAISDQSRLTLLSMLEDQKQTEAALAASEAELRALFAAMHDVVLVIDRDGVYREVAGTNPSFWLIPPQELLGKRLQDVFSAEQAQVFYETIQQVLATKQNMQIEYELNVGNQSVWYEASVSPLGADHTLWVARDITERIRMEEKLSESEQRFRSLFENGAVGVLLSDLRGNVLEINPAALQILGSPSAEATRRINLLTFQPLIEAGFAAALQECGQTVQPIFVENRYVTNWGKAIDVTVRFIPMLDAQGHLALVQILIEDITERKQAEATLRASEARNSALVNAVPDLLFEIDREGTILDYSVPDATLLYAPPAAFLGKNVADILPQPVIRTLMENMTVTLASKKMTQFEYDLPMQPGQQYFEGRLVVLSEDTVLCDIRDITQRKQAEDALRESAARFRKLLEMLPLPVTYVDKTGALTFRNERFVQVFGYTAEDVPTLTEWWQRAYPDPDYRSWAIEAWTAAVERAAATGQDVEAIEYKVTCKNGEQRLVEITGIAQGDEILSTFLDLTEREQAEEALRASENIFRSFLEQSEDAIMLFDQAGVLIQWSKGAEELTGFSREESLGKSLWDIQFRSAPTEFKSAKNYEHLKTVLQTTLRTGQGPMINRLREAELQRRDGTRLTTQTLAFLIQTDQGALLGSILRDITDRKRAEAEREALLEVMQDVRAIGDLPGFLQAVHRAVAKVIYAENFCVIFYNPATGQMTEEYSVDQHDPGPTPPAQLDKSISAYVIRTGQPVRLTPARFAELQASADVDLIGTQPGSWLGVPLKTAHGISGVLVVQAYDRPDRYSEHDQDFLSSVATQVALAIERQRAEEAVRESEQRYRELYESNPVPMWVYETDTLKYLAVNDAAITHYGYTRSEFLDMTIKDLRSAEEQLKLEQFLKQVSPERVRSSVWQHRLKDGTVIDVEIKSHDIQFFGRPARMVLINDITDRLRAETEARRYTERLAAVSVLAQSLAKTLDLPEIYQQLHWAVLQLLPDTVTIFISLLEAKQQLLTCAFGWHEGEILEVAGYPPMPLEPPGVGTQSEAIHRREPVIIDDLAARLQRLQNKVVVGSSGGHNQSGLYVPMLMHDQILGVVQVQSALLNRYTPEDAKLLALVANTAAVAIENARLFASERGQWRRLEILYHASQAINSALDVNGALDRLTDEAMRATKATHGSVLAARRDLNCFERRSLRGYSVELTQKARADKLPLKGGVNGRALQTGEIVYVSDIRLDPDYFPLIPQTRAEMVVPIVQNGRVIGNLDLQSPEPDAFHEADLSLLKALTDQVAVALEKARLFDEIRQHAEELEERVAQRTQELVAVNAHLVELDQFKDRFVSMVSHEYRTPLTTILSSAEMLENYGSRLSAERQQQHLQRIGAAVKHMVELLEDILTIGKAEAHKLEFVPAPIDLEQFCRNLVDEISLAAGSRHQLNFRYQADCDCAQLDATLLRHILSNLLSNAVKYSPQGGDIEFDVACADDQVVFRVSDHGLGIPLEDQANLFESFHRGRNTGQISGTGLGLSIVKHSVDLHQGTIEITSQVDVGTTVTVNLPLECTESTEGAA